MVVPGALSALTVVAQALVGPRRPGARRVAGLPQRPRGAPPRRRPAGRGCRWTSTAGTSTPSAASLRAGAAAAGLPDPRLPEPHRQPDEQRRARAVRRAAAARRHGRRSSTSRTGRCALDGRPMPRPFAAFAPGRRSPSAAPARASGAGCGSAGSAAPPALIERLDRRPGWRSTSARPVLEQLVTARLLERREEHLGDAPRPAARAARRPRRGDLASGCRTGASGSRRGGLSLWCELPPSAGAEARPPSPPRPSVGASWSHPGRSSPSTAGSTRSSGSPSPGPRTSSATRSTASPTAWDAVSSGPRRRGTRRQAGTRVMVA